MNIFKKVIQERGLSLKEMSQKGVSYQTLYKHYTGERKITAESAVLYEKLFGIPRHILRPDLWEFEEKDTHHAT